MKNREHAEQVVLGSALAIPERAGDIWSRAIEVRHWLPQHAPIARVIGALVAVGTEPFPVLVASQLATDGKPDEVVRLATHLAIHGTFKQSVDACLDELLEDDKRQDMATCLQKAVSRLESGHSPQDVSAYLETLTEQQTRSEGPSARVISNEQAGRQLTERIESAQRGEASPFIETSLPDLNRLIGGWRRGLWSVIAARPKMGKTSLWEQEIVWHAKRGRGVIIASLELEPWEHRERMALREAECDMDSADVYRRARKGELEARAKLNETIDDLDALPLVWCLSRRRRRIDQLLSDLRLAHKRCPIPSLVVVDYVQLVHALKRDQRKDLQHGDVVEALSQWLSDTGMAGILVAQLNREHEKAKGRRPRASDIREAGIVEQDCGALCFVHRPNRVDAMVAQDERESCELVVSDVRFGAPGIVPLWWQGSRMRFEARDTTEASWAL
jgi:replicative DNA helicase